MTHHPTHRFFASPLRLVMVATALAGPVAAFGDCTTRAAGPAEAAFHARAMSALVAALPPVPIGAQELDAQPHDFRKPPAMRAVLCDFTAEGAFLVSVRRVYVRKHSVAERRHLQAQYDALTARFHALRQVPADKIEQQNAMRQKSNLAWTAARGAEKAGDKTGAQAQDAEYRSLRDAADAIDAEHRSSVKAQTDELDRRRVAIDLERQKVEIKLGMNLPRMPVTGSDTTRGAFGAARPTVSAGLKVHNVTYAVDGTEGPLRQALANAIDRARLGSMVGKPLPDATESEAFAAGAAPVAVPDIAGLAAEPPAATPGTAGSTPSATTATAATASATPQRGDETPAADPVRKTAEAVNKLRGLLGR